MKRSRPVKKTENLETVLLDKQPPHNLDAEVGVIGSILLDPLVFDDVSMVLRADDFYSERHKILYHRLQEMQAAAIGIDLTLLVDRLEQHGELEDVGGHAYLGEIMGAVGVSAYAVYYAEIVRDKALLRDLIHTSADILRSAYEPELTPRQVVANAEEKMYAINDSRMATKVATMDEVVRETLAILNQRNQHGTMGGVMTQLTDLDRMTSGLHANELIILAARPSMGKTALAMNIADAAAVEQGKTTLVFSLEMAKTELAIRMLCSRARLDGEKLKKNYMTANDRAQLVKASEELAAAPLYIDDHPGRTVTEIGAVARRIKRKKGLDLLIIDYLTLIEPDNPADPRQEQVAKMARRLKGLARALQIPILCLAQLNRQAEATKDNRPRLSHLRESGAIEQDADVVMFVHREEYYHKRDVAEEKGLLGQAEIIIAKQRNGPVGDIKLRWTSECTRFDDFTSSETQGQYTEFAQHSGGGNENSGGGGYDAVSDTSAYDL